MAISPEEVEDSVVLFNASSVPKEFRPVHRRVARVTSVDRSPSGRGYHVVCVFYNDRESGAMHSSAIASVLVEDAGNFDYEQWCSAMGLEPHDINDVS